jgi:hypothetical protein
VTSVEIYVPIDLAATVTRDAMLELMPKIERGARPYKWLSLKIALLSVPIRTQVESRPYRWECGLEISAAHEQSIFPKFRGALSVTPSTSGTCELWLQGGYDLPMGHAGALLDATLLHGTALRSLRTFLDWLADEVRIGAIESEKRPA